MHTDVTLAVLAGGRGARMGRPKGLLTVGGRPVLAHLLDRLAWPGPTLLVTAPGREHPPAWDRFDREATDPTADQGPLRGVLTAVESATTPVVVIVTVDMPGVTPAAVAWMVGQLGDGRGLLLDRGGQIEPFPLVVRPALAEAIRARLAAGRRSVHGLSAEPGVTVRPAPADWPASAWANLNTPADWAAFEAASLTRRGEAGV